MKIGKRIYYDVKTGEIILNTGEKFGDVEKTTVEDDIRIFKALSERNEETFDFLDFEFGEHEEEDALGGYISKIDIGTKKPIFSYPTSEGENVSPKTSPLETIENLKQENDELTQELETANEYLLDLDYRLVVMELANA